MKKILLAALALGLSTATNAQQPLPSCFSHATDFNSGYPIDINRGDYNGDGHDDFAVVRLFADTISVYINAAVPNGFNINSPVSYTTQQYPRAIATADFNKDGKSDIACVNGNPTGSIQELKLLFGVATGNMTSVTLAIPSHTNQMLSKIITKDINADTYVDIVVVTTQNNESNIYTYLNSNGVFGSATATSILPLVGFNSNSGPADMGDFDNDGNMDYIGLVYYNNQTVLGLKLGTGGGMLSSTTSSIVLPISNIQSMYCDDINNDGFSDVVVSGLGGKLAVMSGTTGGNFATTSYTNLTGDLLDVEVYDINNDGYKDIIASGVNTQRFNIMYGTSTAFVFTNPYTYHTGDIFATNLAIGDYNMDGFKDVVTNNTATNLIGFNFNLNPELNSVSSNTYCVGQVANLSAKYPYGNEFTWLPNGGTSNLASIYASGTYSLVMSDAASSCSITSVPITLTFNICTNIEEQNKTVLSIYPNPANSNITINSENSLGSVKIINIIGAEVLAIETRELTYKADISYLNTGVYFIKVGNSITKFIKE